MKTTSTLFRSFTASATSLGLVVLTASLATGTANARPTMSYVGPRPAGQYDKALTGYLTVFSATEETQDGDETYRYPHSAYRILDGNGKTVRWVENHESPIDEQPETVELKPGHYTIRAWSDRDGLVSIPVVIETGRNTRLHLEEGRDKSRAMGANAYAEPSGQVVGWKRN